MLEPRTNGKKIARIRAETSRCQGTRGPDFRQPPRGCDEQSRAPAWRPRAPLEPCRDRRVGPRGSARRPPRRRARSAGLLPRRRLPAPLPDRQLRAAGVHHDAERGPHVPGEELGLLSELPGLRYARRRVPRRPRGDARRERPAALRARAPSDGQRAVACFGGLLFAVCPANDGPLGWYSVHGHALVALFVLAGLLLLLPEREDVGPLTTRRALGVALCMLAASQCWGSG